MKLDFTIQYKILQVQMNISKLNLKFYKVYKCKTIRIIMLVFGGFQC